MYIYCLIAFDVSAVEGKQGEVPYGFYGLTRGAPGIGRGSAFRVGWKAGLPSKSVQT